MIKKSIIIHLLSLICLLLVSPVSATQRVALVIGNSAYGASPLTNPVNDAEDMAAALRQLNFEVILCKNADRRQIIDAVRQFGQKLPKAEIGLFYFAGHGMQIKGVNYLIPINNSIRNEAEVEFEAVNAARIMAQMESAGNPMNIVILDACRDNPFKRNFRTAAQGLARMDAPPGTIIAYATSPGSVAADGSGRNGTYTEALLKNMVSPGLDVHKMFNRTGLDVMTITQNQQVPWLSTTPFPDYFLAGGKPEDIRLRPQSPALVVAPSTPAPEGSEPKIPPGYLIVTPVPSNSRVRILNIKPVYQDGIKLAPGQYHIEVSHPGYITAAQWVELGADEREKGPVWYWQGYNRPGGGQF